jgi:tRNA1(Val) A37 N6-methylase TrmN6
VSEDLTYDAFLGGRLNIWQPRKGYRAGTDPVLLAASVDPRPGQSVLELGCGVGTASLCLNARVRDLRLTGVEIQSDYADLARRNGNESNADFDVVTADLSLLPTSLRQKQFDHVIMNPPYFDRSTGSRSEDHGKDIAFGGVTALSVWLDVGVKRLAPKGYLTLIQRVDRLADVLSVINGRLGSIEIRPIAPRAGKSANLFLLRGRLSGKAPLVLSAPLIVHEGDAHICDRESYTPQVRSILRDGAHLTLLD